jgi:hypothetical protein
MILHRNFRRIAFAQKIMCDNQAFSVVAKNFIIGALEGGALYATGGGAFRLLSYLGEAAKSTDWHRRDSRRTAQDRSSHST